MKKRFTEEQIIGFLREAEAAMRRAQQYSITSSCSTTGAACTSRSVMSAR